MTAKGTGKRVPRASMPKALEAFARDAERDIDAARRMAAQIEREEDGQRLDRETADEQVKALMQLDGLRYREVAEYLMMYPPGPVAILRLVRAAKAAGVSATSSANARQRNAGPRAEVLKAWDERTDQGQSRASFARAQVERLWKRRALKVTARTVCAWIKGRP